MQEGKISWSNSDGPVKHMTCFLCDLLIAKLLLMVVLIFLVYILVYYMTIYPIVFHS